MDLSLYLLLAPSTDGEQTPGADQHAEKKLGQSVGQRAGQQVGQRARRECVPVFDPLRRNTVGSKRLVQASRKTIFVPASKRVTVQSIGFGMSVCANALGFLAITGAALVLLRVAEISLH